ncbi:hypothetical protein BU24DRAFT_464994 [Aaosphaeria arxii CBS 175.79]|uniref:CRIB domain-containing protein n=1 Tax=Aaosphaeria arxii CBS 175.79 TaxID=1450172 RepID=A0A6A5XIG7_9PLEO|nr:uncharacterized protein BU24DRAFT_464994 [Aaosphaeria arxii CBS 175.79]KAF2012621.1 hypothetical protein BU24DRAFT_464994 [Aaosphaeria arxii CBS 175.79]
MSSSDGLASRSSQDLRHLAGHNFTDLPGTKRTLFTRGKRGKRVSGPLSPGRERDIIEEPESAGKRTSVLRKGRKTAAQTESAAHRLKHRISSPFDFQHLTHTDRHQFNAMDQSSENELVAEYWAVRASQAPCSDLNGIKADNLHFNNFSSESLVDASSRSPSALTYRSPPISPELSGEHQFAETNELSSTGRVLRTARSVDSFSRPGINPRLHRHTQSINPTIPPTRTSSRQATRSIDQLTENDNVHESASSVSRSALNRQSGLWDHFSPSPSPSILGAPLSFITDEQAVVGHAFTTPDDLAIHPTTPPPFSPGLEDVLEEPERFASPRPAPPPPARAYSPRSPRSPYFESFSFRSTQRSPISRTSSRGSPFASPKSMAMTRPMSQMSDTLGSPTFSRRPSIRRSPAVRRKSNTWRAIDESWEDDVDYIYDNALEADCDFDWDHMSEDIDMEDRERTPEQRDHERPSTASSQRTYPPPIGHEGSIDQHGPFFSGVFRPSLLVPSSSSVPELDPRSAISASTASTGIRTPCDPFNPLIHHQSNLSLAPSLLAPPDFKEDVSREDMFDEILDGYEGSDRHFPLLDPHQSIASSTRSSRVRSSKRSSYDSSLMSSGQASGSWSSPIRRSASSSGSLPELVQSRRARHDFSMIVDELSEQVACFASFGEDDMDDSANDNTTPPGRQLDQTFFNCDGEETGQETRASIEIQSNVRASLELARQGSVRSSHGRLHHHKYASSDGAAKLLSSLEPVKSEAPPPTSRSRAASSSKVVRGNRQPYLSLFPAPPKHAQSSASAPLAPGPNGKP